MSCKSSVCQCVSVSKCSWNSSAPFIVIKWRILMKICVASPLGISHVLLYLVLCCCQDTNTPDMWHTHSWHLAQTVFYWAAAASRWPWRHHRPGHIKGQHYSRRPKNKVTTPKAYSSLKHLAFWKKKINYTHLQYTSRFWVVYCFLSIF